MVGYDTKRGVAVILDTQLLSSGGNQGFEQIDVVVVVNTLQHCRDALKAHPSIDRGCRKWM